MSCLGFVSLFTKSILSLLQLPEASEKRVKLEKSLADLESKRLSVRNVEREKRNAKRYRKIRFIERQKLSRKLKQLQLLLNSARETVSSSIYCVCVFVSFDCENLFYLPCFPLVLLSSSPPSGRRAQAEGYRERHRKSFS